MLQMLQRMVVTQVNRASKTWRCMP